MSSWGNGCMKYSIFAGVTGHWDEDKSEEMKVKSWVRKKMQVKKWNVREMERKELKKTNFKERISSGRVIKSESQQTCPQLSSPFSTHYFYPFSVISCLSFLPPLHLNLLGFCVNLSIPSLLFFPFKGQLPSFVFLSGSNGLMVKLARSWGG